MQPPVLKRFLVEDYKDAPSWFGRFLQVLNSFMEQTARVLNKNVSYGDNIQSRAFTTTFQTGASYNTGTFDQLSFSWAGSALPIACLVTRIVRDDGTRILTAVGPPEWRYGDGSVQVTYVPGLANSTKYQISFLAF